MPAPNGQGTVVASGNAFAGLRIFEAPGAAALSTINGLVAWQNAQNGLRLYGGEKVKVRNSVFLANVLNGVYVTSFDATRGGQRSVADRSRHGRRTRATTSSRRRSARTPTWRASASAMSPGHGGADAVARAGTSSRARPTARRSTAAIVRSTVCGGFVDLGVVPAAGTTVTVDVASCQ